MKKGKDIEVWGGVECTVNRVGDQYFDQSEYSGHYRRGVADVDLIGSLGIKMLRYPVLWEKHQPIKDGDIDWRFVEKNLERMRELDISPIAGLVHHGSGPRHVNFFDGSFEQGLAEYARLVISKFPWLEYFTPVNEPLTTARFCGLYGHWFPHGTSDYTFYKVLLSECKATVMAMKAIREVNPDAKLIQTEDLGKCYSTSLLSYQAEFENHRRWVSYDLLCGRIDRQHPMWSYLRKAGITEDEILYFIDNNCTPHIAGFNYYITSERYLDHEMNKYPQQYHGGNGKHQYADIETVKVQMKEENGPAVLLREAWEHLHLPIAITECHLHSTREDQMRWFNVMWNTLNQVKDEGVDIRAITAWAIFGLTGWNKLVTEPGGVYEPGVFNVRSGCPRPTALARFIQELTEHKVYYHPVLDNEGWWQRANRQQYGVTRVVQMEPKKKISNCRPLLILKDANAVGVAFEEQCENRNIHFVVLSNTDIDFGNALEMDRVIKELHPWAIVNATACFDTGKTEDLAKSAIDLTLSSICTRHSTRFLTFSNSQVFDGARDRAFAEEDTLQPATKFGMARARAEEEITGGNPEALIIRTSNLFTHRSYDNVISRMVDDLREGRTVTIAARTLVSPTYVPDLVNEALDLLLDCATGVYHIVNFGSVTLADLARQIAMLGGYDHRLVREVERNRPGKEPIYAVYSALRSEKGVELPTIEDALHRFMDVSGALYHGQRIAV